MNLTTIPKAELHCHLDGILDPRMAADIRREEPAFPVHPDDLELGYPVTDLESFFGWWKYVRSLWGRLSHTYPILARYVEQLKAQGVTYAELMVPSGMLPVDRGETVEEMEAFRSWADQLAAGEIQVAFLIAIGRNKTAEAMEEVAGRVLALYQAGLIVGAALAGPEHNNPVKPYHQTFARFHEAGLGIEIHAGEWCGPESVWDALAHGFPDRIGHGVSLFQDPRLIEIFLEQQIHIEMCPTSNFKTGSISRIEYHPISKARQLGMNFSINTDDPGPFECSLLSEYALLADVFGFEQSDFQRVYANAMRSRFYRNHPRR